ncbi:hypothetical protein HPB49_001486 [Dermacentor silvarum]|uniref:Uncharacterized protein n=1 Tax=Dermacentor silvarum TaxID=543639 RepID=A0ACB8DS79_DERSI|nr:hypothetical protein HPB49_001486 [Dermacentor silvarum]
MGDGGVSGVVSGPQMDSGWFDDTMIIREALPRYEARLQRLGWQTLQQRRTVARIGFLCRCLDGSLDDSYISSVVRYSKRTGQPEPMYARTVRHQNSLIPAAVRDFLFLPHDMCEHPSLRTVRHLGSCAEQWQEASVTGPRS